MVRTRLTIYLCLLALAITHSTISAEPIDQGIVVLEKGESKPSEAVVWSGRDDLIQAIGKVVESAQSKTAQRIGISFVDLKQSEALIEYRQNEGFHPASNIKLLTSAAALHVLGARHRWSTTIGTDRTEKSNMGHLMIKGGGDPSLSIGDVSEWVLELKSMGLTQIEGDIIIDATLFESFGLPPGFEEKNQDGAYRAAVSSINLNWNHILVSVSDRGKTRGYVAVFPPNDYVQIINKTVVKPKVRRPISVTQKILKTRQRLTVKGQLKRGHSRKFRRRIGSPLRFFASALRKQLSLNQIRFAGTVKFEAIERMPKLLIRHESQPLSTVLKAINSWSNNLSAEVVVLSMADKLKRKTTFKNGLDIVRNFATKSLGWTGFTLTNGSGLFGSTRVTPKQMTDLLAYMYLQRDLYPDFSASMAMAGFDGTMKKRLAKMSGAQVYAKTGTLDGVSGLSGYIRMRDGDMVAFSILQNDFKTRAGPIRLLQDDIVKAFVKAKSGAVP